jgi:protein-S-isoprenylcysteine O-methyltransferase Ste14
VDIRQKIFELRSYTPIPFLIIMLVFAVPTATSLSVGFLLVILGELLRLWGVSIAGSETRTTGPVGGTNLITEGPFGYVRNPLYVGNMVMYVGVGIMSNALMPWLPVVALCFFFAQYALIVSREEEYLRTAFADEYVRYTENVPRFFPRLTPYRGEHSFHRAPDLSRGLRSEGRTLQALGLISVALVVIFVART